MDTAVALVQAYLHVNGYFTVAEYPVMELGRHGEGRSVTDLDILAFRFAHAGHEIVRTGDHLPLPPEPSLPDPALGCPSDGPDMIVGEVKEGTARFNQALRNPLVLEIALARFGCCPPEGTRTLVQELLMSGCARTPAGHSVRLVAFGDASTSGPGDHGRSVSMRHVVRFLRSYLKRHWKVLRHAQLRDPGLCILALLEKWGVDDAGEPVGKGERW